MVTLGLASVVHLSLLSLFPESASVYGPKNPRSKRMDAFDKPAMRQAA
ncbi:hypothetical protein [Pseudomonas sp. HY7a-MNA-CIBAN-0227]